MKLKNIKETFDNREITPSAGSWDSLASRLDQEEKKSKKPVIYWLGAIAAVLIAALLIYPALNNETGANTSGENQVVNVEDVVNPELNDVPQNVIEENTAVEKIQMVENNTLEIEEKETIIIHKTPLKNQSLAQVPQKAIVENKGNDNALSQETLQSMTQEPILSNNEDTAMATRQPQPSVEVPLTAEEEMELLLNSAMSKVEQPVVAVKEINPDLLLLETEWDIESDNRSRIQNSIQDGLNFLKAEAVALLDQ